MNKLTKLMMVGVSALFAVAVQAQVTLDAVDYSQMPGNKMQIQLTLSGDAPEVTSFTISDPPRIAVDLPATRINLDDASMQVDAGVARQIRAVEAGGRTRLVLSLTEMVPYEMRTEGHSIYIDLNTQGGTETFASQQKTRGVATADKIEDIDFRRGNDGEGNIIITLSNPSSVINVVERGNKINLDLLNLEVPDALVRRLDVQDFATPVRFIDLFPRDGGGRVVVTADGAYEQMAYQTGNTYVLSFRELTPEEVEASTKDEFGYSGERLSLNFQNIEVRAVLQLIADFTGLNVVVSDTVQGNITLRLRNVPWDQALDIILETRGLGMRQTGNVLLVAPNEEIAAREQAQMQASLAAKELAPTRTQFYEISYASASEIADILRSGEESILSERGNVTIDRRTNTLMVLETAEKHEEIATLIRRLDVPVSQVMIESRIVIANDGFSRELGVRSGVTGVDRGNNASAVTTGSVSGTDAMVNSIVNNPTGPTAVPLLDNRYNVNFAAPANAGRVALSVLGSNYLVDLELSALQTENRGEVLSNPRVITSNQNTAKIRQGVEIPYQEATSSGATSVSFKEAVLSLEVTPQITPDDRISMNLNINKDSVGEIYAGVPSIDTRSVETQVLVDNGETVVLGGIYEQESVTGASKVPLLGDIPLLGYLFRSTSRNEAKSELLVFVTPRILKEGMSTGME